MQKPDPTGMTVLILAGEFSDEEGVCLGRVTGTAGLWSVSAHSSDRVVNLRFDEEFGVLLNPGQTAGEN